MILINKDTRTIYGKTILSTTYKFKQLDWIGFRHRGKSYKIPADKYMCRLIINHHDDVRHYWKTNIDILCDRDGFDRTHEKEKIINRIPVCVDTDDVEKLWTLVETVYNKELLDQCIAE